jgi:hypothetical protein
MDDKNNYLLPEKAYSVLKWLGLIALPAIAVFINAVGPAWGWPNIDAVVLTLNSIGVLIGALIGVSQVKNSNASSKDNGNG